MNRPRIAEGGEDVFAEVDEELLGDVLLGLFPRVARFLVVDRRQLEAEVEELVDIELAGGGEGRVLRNVFQIIGG